MNEERQPRDGSGAGAGPDEELATTAEHWRHSLSDTEAAESAEEVARGADKAVEQPGYGREGN